MQPRNRVATRVITTCLFLTGASALVYQVLWTRYLGLLLGSSAVATVVVLTAFMGGLAGGSWLFGRLADRPLRRLSLYAWLELGVGVYCLVFPALHSAWATPYLHLASPLFGRHPVAFTFVRLVLAAVLLLPPTLLMGGTLPAASRFLLGIEPGVRKAVGRLYWVNSAGAVVGALLAGFYLVPAFGLDFTMTLAAAVNIVVGVAALALRARVAEDPTAKPEADPSEEPLPARTALFAVAAVTVSGFAALALEVAWTRLLSLVLGGSTYAFTLMLATFILGIALGSRFAAGPRFAGRDPVLLLAGSLIAVAVSMAAMAPFYERLPYWFQVMGNVVARVPRAWAVYQLAVFVVCFAVMIIPTTAMGATLPFASRIAARSTDALGSRIGLTYAANTLGTLLGAALAGLVFLPILGLDRTVKLVMFLYVVASGLALAGAQARARKGALVLAATALAVAVAVPFLPVWRMQLVASGAFRARTEAPDSFQAWAQRESSGKLLFHQDGPTASVSVVDAPRQRNLSVNGKVDASTGLDMHTQVMSAHIAMLLAPEDARRVMVIGLGSGVTVGSLLTHPNVEVDVAEIEPAVVAAAAKYFREANGDALNNPRAHLIVDDAKTYFRLTKQTYDVIISEPSNPWVAGIGGLFTEEFFGGAKEKLRPGGVMMQWFHGYEFSDAGVQLVLRTFRRAFKYVTLWQALPSDFLMVGTDEPVRADFDAMARRLSVPAVAESMRRVGVDGLAAVLALQSLSPGAIAHLANEGPTNSDQFPMLEYTAPKAFFVGRPATLIRDYDERTMHGTNRLLLSEYAKVHPLDRQALRSVGRAVETDPGLPDGLLRHAFQGATNDPGVARAYAASRYRAGCDGEVAEVLESLGDGHAESLRLLASARLRVCNASRSAFSPGVHCDEAVRYAERVAALPAVPADAHTADLAMLGAALNASGHGERAMAVFSELLSAADAATRPAVERARWFSGYAIAASLMGNREAATRAAATALSLDDTQTAARRVLVANTEIDGAPATAGAKASP